MLWKRLGLSGLKTVRHWQGDMQAVRAWTATGNLSVTQSLFLLIFKKHDKQPSMSITKKYLTTFIGDVSFL